LLSISHTISKNYFKLLFLQIIVSLVDEIFFSILIRININLMTKFVKRILVIILVNGFSFHHWPSESPELRSNERTFCVGVRANHILHACMCYNVVMLHELVVRMIFLVGPIGHDERKRSSGGDDATSWLPCVCHACLHILRISEVVHLETLSRWNDLSFIYVLPTL